MNFFNNKGCGVCFEIETRNGISLVAILDKQEFATVLCLNKAKECWECGHYFKELKDAYRDYQKRQVIK